MVIYLIGKLFYCLLFQNSSWFPKFSPQISTLKYNLRFLNLLFYFFMYLFYYLFFFSYTHFGPYRHVAIQLGNNVANIPRPQ
jgi:hypothetical protein